MPLVKPYIPPDVLEYFSSIFKDEVPVLDGVSPGDFAVTVGEKVGEQNVIKKMRELVEIQEREGTKASLPFTKPPPYEANKTKGLLTGWEHNNVQT